MSAHDKKRHHHASRDGKKKHKEPSQEQKEEQAIEESLGLIYNEEEMDFAKLEQGQGALSRTLGVVAAILGVIAILGWGGFFLYNRFIAPNQMETFTLSIEADEAFVSGEKTTIEIDYRNPMRAGITNLNLDIRLPESFIVESYNPLPSNLEETIWEIGNLGALTDEKITIEGMWYAGINTETPIQAIASYKPTNFNADFQEIETIYIGTETSTLELAAKFTEEVTPGEEASYQISIEQTGTESLENLRLDLELPEGFIIESSDPELSGGGAASWDIETIDPEEVIDITFDGTFAADIEGFQFFTPQLYANPSGRYLLQDELEFASDVLASGVDIQLVANGKQKSIDIEPGDTIRLTTAIENTGENTLEPVSLLLDFGADGRIPITWSEADLGSGTLRADGIFFDSTDLGVLEEGERTILNLTLPVYDVIGGSDSDTFTLTATLNTGTRTIDSGQMQFGVLSDTNLTASVRYYNEDGGAIGSGPMPPEVGATTRYQVSLRTTNTLHDVRDARATAQLAPNVRFAGDIVTTYGTIVHDEDDRLITWEIGELAANESVQTASFFVEATPTSGDLDAFMALLSAAEFTGIDSKTEGNISVTAEKLTTELVGDAFADNQGIVTE